MSRFRDAYDEFRRAGIEVAAISVDSHHSHRAFARELDIPYPMLSDFNRAFLAGYGVPERNAGLLERLGTRSAFVVDADGIIRYAWYVSEAGGQPPVDEILEAARRLTPGGDR